MERGVLLTALWRVLVSGVGMMLACRTRGRTVCELLQPQLCVGFDQYAVPFSRT